MYDDVACAVEDLDGRSSDIDRDLLGVKAVQNYPESTAVAGGDKFAKLLKFVR